MAEMILDGALARVVVEMVNIIMDTEVILLKGAVLSMEYIYLYATLEIEL